MTLASIRPSASATDRKTWQAYDAANRLVKSVAELGEVTEFSYDSASRVIASRRYATAINTSALGSAPSPAAINPTASAADRVERSFYDNDGRLLATLDATGGLSENQYDAAGQLIAKVLRATLVNPAYAATGTLAQLRPADAAGDSRILYFYNARGQLAAQLDAVNNLTENLYDTNGNLSKTLRYATASHPTTPGSSLASARTGAGVAQEQSAYSYDAINRVLTQRADPNGLNLSTTYQYDDANGKLNVTNPAGTLSTTTLDVKGQALSVAVDPNGLNVRTSQTYDSAGRVQTSTDAAGTVTQYGYDAMGAQDHPTG